MSDILYENFKRVILDKSNYTDYIPLLEQFESCDDSINEKIQTRVRILNEKDQYDYRDVFMILVYPREGSDRKIVGVASISSGSIIVRNGKIVVPISRINLFAISKDFSSKTNTNIIYSGLRLSCSQFFLLVVTNHIEKQAPLIGITHIELCSYGYSVKIYELLEENGFKCYYENFEKGKYYYIRSLDSAIGREDLFDYVFKNQ